MDRCKATRPRDRHDEKVDRCVLHVHPEDEHLAWRTDVPVRWVAPPPGPSTDEEWEALTHSLARRIDPQGRIEVSYNTETDEIYVDAVAVKEMWSRMVGVDQRELVAKLREKKRQNMERAVATVDPF